MKVFDNIEELAKFDKEVAEELKEVYGDGGWKEEQLYYHENKKEFADYELTEGWYSYGGLNDRDWNGAPNPIDHVDLESLGEDLVNSWDVSGHYLTKNGEIVQTSHGW